MKKRKAIKTAIGWLLAGAQVAADGLTSARQIADLAPTPYVGYARYAACGATIVEGEIYRKNIIEGFSRFSLLSEKTLWQYLIIEKFEDDLVLIEQYEKEIKNNLYDFFVDINKKYKLKKIVNDEDIFQEIDYDKNTLLSKYKKFHKKENPSIDVENQQKIEEHSIDAKNQQEIKEYFSNFKLRRDGTPSYVEPEDELRFLNLEKNLKKLVFLKTSFFVASYVANQHFIKQVKLCHKKKSETKEVKARLKLLKKLLIKSVVEPKSCELLNNAENLSEDFINELKEEVSKKVIKLWPLRFGMLFSLGVGLCLGVITFYTFPAVLIALGLSTTIASVVIWPLAILAAISYAILIYNTSTDLILNETLSTWWRELNKEIEQTYNGRPNILKYICLVIGKSFAQFFNKLINWFKLKEQETFCTYAVRMVLSFMALACGLIVAGATGFTAFIQLKQYVNVTLCTIATLSFMSSELLFILKNSFQTVGLLAEGSINNLFKPFIKSYKNLVTQLVTQMPNENYLQHLLHLLRIPLKIVLSIFKLLIFGTHVFFTGVASDRFFNLPCLLMVGISALSELMTDVSQLFSNKQADHHDHDHGGIFNWIGKIIFIIPATILGILNCLFSQLNRCTSTETSSLGLLEAIKQEWHQFDIKHVHEHLADNVSELNESGSARTLPKAVAIQKAINICKDEIGRLSIVNSDSAQEKVVILKAYMEKLKQNNQTDSNNNITLENEKRTTLGKHRFLTTLGEHSFFKRGKTESMSKIEEIETLISPYMVNDNNHVFNGHARAL
ncbi:hypothetical protein [Rickettsiella endosymbiont of Rhagonycha lignosa]|uniref:hypothetical protein n=1 Tax=Rickettsiella endosymbiont of Rhagonycha lignosa TaxID=3077937 RepID=UPI00313CC90C